MEDREPSFLREIGVVVLIFAKVTAVALAVVGVLTPLFLWRAGGRIFGRRRGR